MSPTAKTNPWRVGRGSDSIHVDESSAHGNRQATFYIPKIPIRSHTTITKKMINKDETEGCNRQLFPAKTKHWLTGRIFLGRRDPLLCNKNISSLSFISSRVQRSTEASAMANAMEMSGMVAWIPSARRKVAADGSVAFSRKVSHYFSSRLSRNAVTLRENRCHGDCAFAVRSMKITEDVNLVCPP